MILKFDLQEAEIYAMSIYIHIMYKLAAYCSSTKRDMDTLKFYCFFSIRQMISQRKINKKKLHLTEEKKIDL